MSIQSTSTGNGLWLIYVDGQELNGGHYSDIEMSFRLANVRLENPTGVRVWAERTQRIDATIEGDDPVIEPGEDYDIPAARVEASIGGQSYALDLPAGERSYSGVFSAFNDSIVGVSLENVMMDNSETLAGRYRVTVGDRVVFDDDLDIHAHCRTRPLRDWTPKPLDNPMMGLFLNYGEQAKGAQWLGTYNDGDNGPMGIGYVIPAMETTGERPEIGPRMGHDAAAMCDPRNPDLLAVVRGMADAAGPVPYHFFDEETNAPLDTRTYPQATTLWAANSKSNPISIGTDSKISLYQAAAHAPAFGVGGYAFYGSEFDRQNMISWALYVGRLWNNPAYCARGGKSVAGPSKDGYVRGQVRGFAWSLRSLVDAYIVAPGHALLKLMIDDLADGIIAYFDQHRPNDPVRFLTSGGYYDGKGMACWQWDFLVWAMCHAVNHGHGKFLPLIESMAPLMLGRINHRLPELSSVYSVAYTDGNRLFSWDAMLQETAKYDSNIKAALLCQSGSMALQQALHGDYGRYQAGDLTGYPWSATGYAAIYGMALAGMAQVGITGGAEAYAKWSSMARCDFSWNPQYGVRP